MFSDLHHLTHFPGAGGSSGSTSSTDRFFIDESFTVSQFASLYAN